MTEITTSILLKFVVRELLVFLLAAAETVNGE